MRILGDFRLRLLTAIAAAWSCPMTQYAAAQPVAPYAPAFAQSPGAYATGPVYSYQQQGYAIAQAPAGNIPGPGAQGLYYTAPETAPTAAGPAGQLGYQVPTGAPVEVALGRRGASGVACATGGCDSGCATGGCATGSCATGGCGSDCGMGILGHNGQAYSSFGAPGYGGCAGYTTYGGGLAGGLGSHLGLGGGCGGYGCGNGGNYWFGGVYGLLMEVNTSSYVPLAFAGAGFAVGDYPTRNDFVLYADDADVGYQGGFESRLGRTFGASGCGGPNWGLEGVYWQIFEDSDTATYVDNGTTRTYGMSDFRGIEYDPGTGYRPANHYDDYAPPVADYTNGGALDLVEVRSARVRRSYELTNVELNLLRFSLCGGGAFLAAGPSACGGGSGYSMDSCGMGGGCSSGGCAAGGCASRSDGFVTRGQNCCGSRFSCTGVFGARYLQIDEGFLTGYDYQNTVSLATGYIDRHINVENSLVGFQTGCNGLYRIGCRWGLHMNSLVGVYGNDIDVHHYFNTSGTTRFIGTAEAADVRASKTDVAILGELRLGASYLAAPNMRIYGGWRVLGISGVGLATDQIPGAYTDAAALRWIDSDGSLIVHGLQTGLQWNY